MRHGLYEMAAPRVISGGSPLENAHEMSAVMSLDSLLWEDLVSQAFHIL